MPANTLTFEQLQALGATSYSSVATLPANTDAGSTCGSILNAMELVALNVQYDLLYAIAIARLSTTLAGIGTTTSYQDLVTFCAAFGITPIGASESEGGVTLTTPSPVSSPFIIPVNSTANSAIVGTSNGLQFQIIADASNEYFNVADNAYVIPTGQSSCIVTVQCLTAGTIGNVAIGQINTVVSSNLTSLTASNAAAFTNGVNQESATALCTRFTTAMSTGVVATANAITAAILAVQAGLTVSIGDQINADGSAHPAFFTAVVNVLGQSTGPGSPLLTACTTAINNVRAAGISFACIGPTLITANASANLVLDAVLPAGTTSAQVVANAVEAYQTLVNNIGLNPNGGTTVLPISLVYATLQNVAGVAWVDGLTVNGATADITAAFAFQIVAGTASFSTSTASGIT